MNRAPSTASGTPGYSIPLALWSLIGLALAGFAGYAGIMAAVGPLGFAPEAALVLGGGGGMLVAFVAGALGAGRFRRLGFRELCSGGVLFVAAATVWLGPKLLDPMFQFDPAKADLLYLATLLGNPLGGLLVGLVGLWLTCIIGATVGYLLLGSGRFDAKFGYEFFIAQSHLRLRKRSATRLMTFISVGGVALGVFALTVVLSVMSGFEIDLKNKIVGTNAHAILLKYGTDFSEWSEVAQKVRAVPGIAGLTPFTMNEVMITSEQNVTGAMLKGIEPATIGQVSTLAKDMTDGSIDWLVHPDQIRAASRPEPLHGKPSESDAGDKDLPGILMGREMAASLKVDLGSRVNVVNPLGGEIGPTGPMPKSRPFRVAGIFVTGMFEYDSKFAYLALSEAQDFSSLGSSVSGLELKTTNLDDTRHITQRVVKALDGYPYRTKDWGEMNKNLFSALRLEKLVISIFLTFIVLVACFSIVSTLIMMVLEKGKEIAILKSMGAKNTSIMKVFVIEGLVIGVVGTVLGAVLGLLTCLLIKTGIIGLNAEIYYIERLPVQIDLLQIAFVAGLAILLSYLATIYPAMRASRLSPVDGLRND